ncbi:excalibur calcium-binding domain-containing protein [Tsuneonella sp. SYSU-LHT278]|uniref:excalibur calcium-binding domain-containing protein n=1 Tax=Tsuneonella sediminis TaxID=3416089 RepID=UPI003F792EA6
MARSRNRKRDELGYADIAIYALIAFAGVWFLYPRVQTMMMSAEEIAAIENSVTYSGCNEVRALGKDPIYRGEPGYRDTMDGDGDGIACEPLPY